MKITVSSTALRDAVKTLSKVLNKRNALPILDYFRFDVTGNELAITASDGNTTLQKTVVLSQSSNDGQYCVDSRQMLDALKNISEQPITLVSSMVIDTLTVTHASGEMYFPILSADEYPMPKIEQYENKLTVDGTNLIEAIERCVWTVAKDELRPIMSGVYFDIDGDGLTVVASDGHCIVKTEIFVGADFKAGFILNAKSAQILSKQPKGSELTISFNNQWALIESDSIRIYSRLIEGKYVSYNKVIPEDHEFAYQADVNRLALISALKKVEPFTYRAHNCKMALEFGAENGNQLKVSGNDYDMSMGASDSIAIEYSEGDPMTIGVNGIILAKMLKHFDALSVRFSLCNADRAIVISDRETEPDEDKPVVTMLVMPIYLG